MTSSPPALADAFRQAMRRHGSTITLITTTDGGEPHGMAATAMCSLTNDPPSLLIGVHRGASIHDILLRTRRFCVNLLMRRHEALVEPFSGRLKGSARFAAGAWKHDEHGIPILADSQASLCCQLSDSLAYGSHSIFIGRIYGVEMRDPVAPLLWVDGRFAG